MSPLSTIKSIIIAPKLHIPEQYGRFSPSWWDYRPAVALLIIICLIFPAVLLKKPLWRFKMNE